MSQIKKHQCPSCGGNLIDDSEKQMYRCTSCGSSYDYDYFREEQLQEMGETYLSRGEVNAAVDAYKLILKKDPHDFLALRGLMLAAAFLKDMDGFARTGEEKHFSYDSKLVGEVLDAASEEDKEYFTEFGKIYVNKQKQIDLNREIKSLGRKRESIEAGIRFTDNTRYEYYFESKYGQHSPNTVFIIVWILTAFFSVPTLIRAFDNIDEGKISIFFAVVGGLSLLIGLGINFLIVYPKMKMIKEIDAEIRNLKNESEATAGKISTLEAEAEMLSDEIRKAIRDFVKKDSLKTKDSIKEQVSDFGKIKKHQCPSCGGSLRIDSDKQMYYCAFCGATFDYEYFREERVHEAGETYLSRGEFMATTEAYEFMLKKDPHDFLALRGLMLAAAHLTDMSDLDHFNESFSYDDQMVNRVLENASEEDKEYFTEFAKVYAEKKSLNEFAEEIEALREEKGKIDSVIDQNNKGREDNYVKGEFSSKEHPKYTFIVVWIITGTFLLLTLGFAKGLIDAYASKSDDVAFYFGAVLFFGVITLGYGAGNCLDYFPRMRKIKKFEKANVKFYEEAGKMEDKIRELENESSKHTSDIKRTVHDFVKRDRLVMRDKTT